MKPVLADLSDISGQANATVSNINLNIERKKSPVKIVETVKVPSFAATLKDKEKIAPSMSPALYGN